jgi:hypothetical protein
MENWQHLQEPIAARIASTHLRALCFLIKIW